MAEASFSRTRQRTAAELAELREVRQRFQREKPTLKQVLACTAEQARELVLELRRESERQKLTLAQLAKRTGYDPAVLSRLFTGRQANTTLATIGRIANALGKEVVHALRDMPEPARAVNLRPKRQKTARR